VTGRQLTAVVRAKVPFAEIPVAQRSARAALDAALPSLDAGPPGQPLTRFRTPAKDVLDMEIGTIVGRNFAAKGEIVPPDLPKSTCPGRASIPPRSSRISTRCSHDLGPFGARHAWQARQAR
jgi:hypothetical protein